MTVVDDVITNIGSIDGEIVKCKQMCDTADEAYWPIGDAGYTDFKSIILPIAQDIVTLVAALNVLTS